MAKRLRLNGTARWIIVALTVLGLAFNSGILYNDVKHLSKAIEKLEKSHGELNEKFDKLLLHLAERSSQ